MAYKPSRGSPRLSVFGGGGLTGAGPFGGRICAGGLFVEFSGAGDVTEADEPPGAAAGSETAGGGAGGRTGASAVIAFEMLASGSGSRRERDENQIQAPTVP